MSASGGQLDVDANAGCEDTISSPVENIFWPENGAPVGEYRVEVHYFAGCELGEPVPFRIRLLVDGQVSEFSGIIEHENDQKVITSFQR